MNRMRWWEWSHLGRIGEKEEPQMEEQGGLECGGSDMGEVV